MGVWFEVERNDSRCERCSRVRWKADDETMRCDYSFDSRRNLRGCLFEKKLSSFEKSVFASTS